MSAPVQIEIEYCQGWGYKSGADALVERLCDDVAALEPEHCALNPGRTGAFEVKVDGKLVHSKLEGGKSKKPANSEAEYCAIRDAVEKK